MISMQIEFSASQFFHIFMPYSGGLDWKHCQKFAPASENCQLFICQFDI